MVLSDLGIDPTPILAGAGILGLTVGLGAQAIVQDLLNGIFLLFEDQILIGDYLRIEDTEGMVEEITPRVTRIRDRYGRLHILRNGEIKNVINYSRGWTLAVVEMSVAFESDLKKVLQVMSPPRSWGSRRLTTAACGSASRRRWHPACTSRSRGCCTGCWWRASAITTWRFPYPKNVGIEISGDPPAWEGTASSNSP